MPLLIHKKPNGNERALEFGNKPLIIGRLAESDIPVQDTFISRVHCGIGFSNNQFVLKDLGSTNGTYRNGARVFECALSSGDKIQVGNTTLVFEVDKVSGNALVRQVPQMVAPPHSSSGSMVPRPDPKNVTMPVESPVIKPPKNAKPR